jgi:sulfane dehydrogenase subunit SoxC
MHSKRFGRRRFLKEGAAIAGLTAAAIGSASGQGQTLGSATAEAPPKDSRAYGERSRFLNSVRTLDRTGQVTPLQDLMGIITPSALHFVQSRGYDPPDLDPRQHRLLIHGMVDRPLVFTLEELKRFPSVSRILFLECPGNTGKTALEDGAATVQQTHGKTSCSEWTGVPVSLLLQEAGVQAGAYWLVAEGAEKGNRAQSVPLEKAMDDALVAYGQNGEPLRPEQGFPIRLLLPGCTGGVNTKWLRRIKVVEQPELGIWDLQQGNAIRVSPDGKGGRLPTMPPKSVITFPSGGQRLAGRGFYEITGLAWSGRGAIRRVEVSTDGGQTWKDAQLQDPVLPLAHTRFRFPWNWNGEEAVIQSRCTDDQGEVQPTLAELSQRRGIRPGSFQSDWVADSYARLGLNAVQPWKVTREGSVSNAMF